MSVRFIKGAGAINPDLIVIGEAPGKSEAEIGEPFVGRSGKLLKTIINDVYPNLKIYYTNVVKVRPDDNRTPTNEEIKSWLPLLVHELADFNPKGIIAVGLTAGKALSDNFKIELQEVRSKVHTYSKFGNNVPYVITYHPAYILRNRAALNAVIDDVSLLNFSITKEFT